VSGFQNYDSDAPDIFRRQNEAEGPKQEQGYQVLEGVSMQAKIAHS